MAPTPNIVVAIASEIESRQVAFNEGEDMALPNP